MLIFASDDLYSMPQPELQLDTGPGVQSEMPRDLWDAARTYRQHSDSASIFPSSGARSIIGVFSMAAELEGDSPEGSNMACIVHVRLRR